MKMVLVGLLLAAGWVSAQDEPVSVVVSMQPQYDLVRQITGDAANVSRILPVGASPHTFEPTPSDVVTLAGADLIVTNGVIDDWLLDAVAASGTDAPVLTLLDELDFSPITGDEHDHEGETHEEEHGEEHEEEHANEAHEHRYENANPHIWNDPLLMEEAVPVFVAALSQIDPAHAATFEANGETLRQSLRELNTELAGMLEPVQTAPFVPFHDAWPYFVRRYGLNQVAVIEPAPGREPTPSYLAEVLAQLATTGAKAIFNDAQLPPRPAEVAAEEAGVALYTLDPEGGGVDGEQRYQDLMRQNAGTILEALQ